MITKLWGTYWLRVDTEYGSAHTEVSKEKIPYVKATLMVARMKTKRIT